jgi:hypothetical protein
LREERGNPNSRSYRAEESSLALINEEIDHVLESFFMRYRVMKRGRGHALMMGTRDGTATVERRKADGPKGSTAAQRRYGGKEEID